MISKARVHPIITTILVFANLLAPSAPLLRAQDGTSVWLPLIQQNSEPGSAIPVSAIPVSDLLFRTGLTVQDPAHWVRLTQLAVPILSQETDHAVVLADYDQLQTLARLRYQPRNSVEFGLLVNASAAQKPWLARSLQPLTAQLAAVRSTAAPPLAQTATAADAQAALTALRTAVNQLSAEQRAGLATLPTLDDDGDGLTNTEESWWCTDPLNPNSDGDAQGYSDGQEVTALLDGTLSRTVRWGYGPPFGPPAAWPDFNNKDSNTATPACNDGDFDTIPDYAEAYMVGTRVGTQDMENTDGDKFDDGQELFGVTYCPGAPNSCGWGNYPRTQDFSFITSAMPSWVRAPGDSPFVAAYPVLEFNVDPATIRITTKEIRTIEKTITEGTEIAEGFAETKGNSTSVGTIDTNTRSGWQEHSSSVGGIEPAKRTSSLSATEETLFTSLNPGSNLSSDFHFIHLPEQALVERNIQGTAKLYTDKKFRFSVEIPSGWSVMPAIMDGAGGATSFFSYTPGTYSQKQGIPSHEMKVDIGVATLEKPIEETLYTWVHENQMTETIVLSETTVTIADLPAIRMDLQALTGLKSRVWYIDNEGIVYFVVALPLDSPKLDITEEFVRSIQFSQDTQPLFRAMSIESKSRVVEARTSAPSGYRLPFSGEQTITSGPGCYYTHGGDGYEKSSEAIDYANGQNYEVVATQEGNVIDSPDGSTEFGTYIKIRHPNGNTSLYAHLSSRKVAEGNQVKRGEPIGISGTTGNSTAIHLHFEVRNSADQSIWIRDLPTTTWYKSDINDPCMPSGQYDGKAVYTGTAGDNDTLSIGKPGICYAPPVPTPIPTPTMSAQQNSTNFLEKIGRTVSSWWGRLTGSSAMSSSIAATSNQVAGRSTTTLDQSSKVSAGACGGSGGQTNGDTLGIGGGGSGLAFNDDGGGNFTALRTWSETTTTGEGWSTSHSDVRTETEYAEITRSTVNTLVSSEAWSTATTADPTDAARLTFNYALANTGSDLAVQVTGLRANILIGDLPVITTNLPDRTNLEPSKAKGPFGSDSIPLTLDQLAAIDNGAPIRVVLADYGYNDSLYDTNAWGRSVLFHVDDGIADGNETFDTYLIATNLSQNETYQETLARYFPVTVFDGGADDERTGTLTSITTPEYDVNGEITAWVKHPVNDHAWWELSISTGGETPGVKNFKTMPAKAKTDIYLRYMVDTDGDGYTDRAERDAGTDMADPESHPRSLLVAAKHTATSGNVATVQLALQNFGNFDASSVEIWAIAPDDSITIDDNLVGGGGRVRAGRRVVLGTRLSTPDLTTWPTSTAKPAPSGQYDGAVPATFQFRADTAGTVGSTAGLQVSWSVDGTSWTPLNVGSGYNPWTPLPLRDGISIAFSPGLIAAGESFRFETTLPIDTFRYTINRTPATPPLLIVSYNDAQGNHKFVADVEVTQIQADLIRYYAEMRRGLQLDVRQANPFQVGTNQAWLTLHNPSDTAITGGNLSALVVTPDGTVAKEYMLNEQTFQPGPNVVTLAWNTADFTPAFDPNTDYHLLVFATDRQGTIIENTVRDLDTLHKDALPTAIFMGELWNFGTVTQGEVLERTFTVANIGFADLQSRLSVPAGMTILNATSQSNQPGDLTTIQLALDTRVLATGSYSGVITLRTSDPAHPTYTIDVTGVIEPVVGDAYARPVVDRPLDVEVWVPGIHDRGDWVQFNHLLAPNPDQIHPVKVFSQDDRLLGMGEYAISFADSTVKLGAYGTGQDGDIEINTDVIFDPSRTALVQSVQSGQATIELANVTGFDVGEEILLLQVQGERAGIYEFARIYAKTNNQLTLYGGLSNIFTQGGSAKVQVIQVPNYRNVKITSTGRWRAPAWNGSDGGIIVFRAAENLLIEAGGLFDGIGKGFRGTGHGPVYRHQTGVQGEGYSGNGSQTWSANGNGGGGGQGSQDGGGGGGGGHATAGANGVTGQPNSRIGGSGGQSIGVPDLSQWFLGGAGGEGGADEDGGHPGSGGNGGGIIALFAKSIIVNGSIYSNGSAGGNGCQGCGGSGSGMAGGGGGAGGTLFIQGFNITLNNSVLQVDGGGGGYGYNQGGHGGGGATGRIHAEYCGTLTGTIAPMIDHAAISCIMAYQDNALLPPGTKLALPEHFANGQLFRFQYGHKLDFAAGGGLTTLLRVPAGNWTSAALDALVSGVGTGDLTFKLDVGNDGTWDWEETQAVTNAATFATAQLAAAFAPYVTGRGPGDVPVDVPVKVYLSQPGQVLLTNMAITRDQAVELVPSFALAGTPTEGATVPLNASVANRGAVDSGPLTVSYYATQHATRNTPTYVGSTFIPNIPAGESTAATFDWHTLGFTGPVTVTAAVDPFNRLAELDESNNHATSQLTILTRPDLAFRAVTLSNEEPLAGEPVTVTVNLQNQGQTAAGAQTMALYQGNPDGGGTQLAVQNLTPLAGDTNRAVALQWTPTTPGRYRLFLRGDRDNQVNEYDERNNDHWLDLYVGFGRSITLDSGGGSELPYAPQPGYGVVDEGKTDILGQCGAAADQSYRQDTDGRLRYRFDHLLPGHFYHLDVTLYNCPGQAQRLQSILVDGGNITATPVDLGDGEVHHLSFLLDPAFYADRSIDVLITAGGINGAVINAINLHDVDYRYADAGGTNDPQYPGTKGYGWLDGTDNRTWGRLPIQSVRTDQLDKEVRYRFDGLQLDQRYNVHLAFLQGSGSTPTPIKLQIDGVDSGSTFNLITGERQDKRIAILPVHYQTDGSIVVSVVRPDLNGPFLSEIALEAETVAATGSCVVRPTTARMDVYGGVTIENVPAPVGTLVQAINPRGDTVGCFTVTDTGIYGDMPVYAEDATATPPIPGMRDGELVTFRVNGAQARVIPAIYWREGAVLETTVDAGRVEGQSITLTPDWNFFSLAVESAAPLAGQVLGTINGRYDRVVAEEGAYLPNREPIYNTLKELHCGPAYLLRVTGGTTANLLVEGRPCATDAPIALHSGWNWIGYPLAVSLPITAALQSIEGRYQRIINLTQSYDPTRPTFSTLKQLEPDKGYMIYMNEAATLTYPATTARELAQFTQPAAEICGGVRPTPSATMLYGTLQINGTAAPTGTKVELLTAAGEVAGCFVVEQPGLYGMVFAYGADKEATPAIPGFAEGEEIAVRVNGHLVQRGSPVHWQDDKAPHQLDLAVTFQATLYLPFISVQGE